MNAAAVSGPGGLPGDSSTGDAQAQPLHFATKMGYSASTFAFYNRDGLRILKYACLPVCVHVYKCSSLFDQPLGHDFWDWSTMFSVYVMQHDGAISEHQPDSTTAELTADIELGLAPLDEITLSPKVKN